MIMMVVSISNHHHRRHRQYQSEKKNPQLNHELDCTNITRWLTWSWDLNPFPDVLKDTIYLVTHCEWSGRPWLATCVTLFTSPRSTWIHCDLSFVLEDQAPVFPPPAIWYNLALVGPWFPAHLGTKNNNIFREPWIIARIEHFGLKMECGWDSL